MAALELIVPLPFITIVFLSMIAIATILLTWLQRSNAMPESNVVKRLQDSLGIPNASIKGPVQTLTDLRNAHIQPQQPSSKGVQQGTPEIQGLKGNAQAPQAPQTNTQPQPSPGPGSELWNRLHDVLKQDSSSQPPSQLWNNLKEILGPEPPQAPAA
jgi:hypothetical protein